MVELSPFRTIIDLNAPPPMITLNCPLIDVTPDLWSATDACWPGCGMQFPGALTLTFTDQVVNGIAHEPIGIAARCSRTFNSNWLGGEQPSISVLYRVNTATVAGGRVASHSEPAAFAAPARQVPQ